MTLAAIDRLVYYSTIFDMNVESYRRRAALHRSVVQAAHHERDNQGKGLIDARRQSNSGAEKNPCKALDQRQS